METFNIGGDECDDFYRYKCEKIQVKAEGNKSVLVNVVKVCKDLNRSVLHLSKCIGILKHTQSRYVEDRNVVIVNGKFSSFEMQEIVNVFIENFVLCKECGSPETIFEIKGKKKNIKLNLFCSACGEKTNIPLIEKLAISIAKDLFIEKSLMKKT